MKVLIIVPAYNEGENILKTSKAITDYREISQLDLYLIVINDGSTDNTEQICSENNIPVITLIENLGIGGAVQTGYKYALDNDFDIAIQFDGDGQHNVEFLIDLINPIISKEADMTIGSRFINPSKGDFLSSKARRIGIKVISSFIYIISKKVYLDTTSGFRAINKAIIKKFAYDYPREYPEPITLAELTKMKYKIKEIPVKMNNREAGISSIKAWKSVYYMINVLLSIIVIGTRRYK